MEMLRLLSRGRSGFLSAVHASKVPFRGSSVRLSFSTAAKREYLAVDALLFFQACRKEVVDQDLASFERQENQISRVVHNDRVEAYILPKSLKKWPSFCAMKRNTERFPEIYFKRIADTHTLRFNETVKLLRDKEKVISTGIAGTNKSTEVNGLLMTFLANIGNEGWPNKVCYRFDNEMLEFSLGAINKPHVELLEMETLGDVFKYTKRYPRRRPIEQTPVLLLEMRENEDNPLSFIPTYIPLSNRDAHEATKDMQKAGAHYMLVDPPKLEDLQSMAVLEENLRKNSVFKDMSVASINAEVKRRFDLIGPKTCEIFKSLDVFNDYEKSLTTNAVKVFGSLRECSARNYPDGAKNYIGVFLEDGEYVPSLTRTYENKPKLIYQIRFLSDFIAKIVATKCQEKDKATLEEEEFHYLIAEAIMCHALRDLQETELMNENWTYNKWDFFENLSKPHKKLKSANRPVFPLCTKEVKFPLQRFEKNVTELEEKTLYRSGSDIGKLYDAMLVDHTNQTVYVFQSRKSKPYGHFLDYKTVLDVMNRLHMLDAECEYKMVYVYCYDWSKKLTTGCEMTNMSKMSKETTNQIDKKFSILIARVCYYPHLKKV